MPDPFIPDFLRPNPPRNDQTGFDLLTDFSIIQNIYEYLERVRIRVIITMLLSAVVVGILSFSVPVIIFMMCKGFYLQNDMNEMKSQITELQGQLQYCTNPF
jgi:hypothetical protein